MSFSKWQISYLIINNIIICIIHWRFFLLDMQIESFEDSQVVLANNNFAHFPERPTTSKYAKRLYSLF